MTKTYNEDTPLSFLEDETDLELTSSDSRFPLVCGLISHMQQLAKAETVEDLQKLCAIPGLEVFTQMCATFASFDRLGDLYEILTEIALEMSNREPPATEVILATSEEA